jgi:hypothetical protein
VLLENHLHRFAADARLGQLTLLRFLDDQIQRPAIANVRLIIVAKTVLRVTFLVRGLCWWRRREGNRDVPGPGSLGGYAEVARPVDPGEVGKRPNRSAKQVVRIKSVPLDRLRPCQRLV